MNFSFGIVTSKATQNYIDTIINSIIKLNIPEYEIIIVGGDNKTNTNIRYIYYDENNNNNISIKKNLIAKEAKYENIVFLHDYIVFEDGWYEGFVYFNLLNDNDWLVAMCIIKNNDGTRGIDWMGLPSDNKYGNVLLPYCYCNPKGMYVPGQFFIVKKSFILANPLDESREWGDAEDIEWSKRIFGGINSVWLRNMLRIPMNRIIDESGCTDKYRMNVYSTVKYLKNKPTSSDFLKVYDSHSGDNSRPDGYKREDYEYMIKTNRYS